jgi:hypothetical protein
MALSLLWTLENEGERKREIEKREGRKERKKGKKFVWPRLFIEIRGRVAGEGHGVNVS